MVEGKVGRGVGGGCGLGWGEWDRRRGTVILTAHQVHMTVHTLQLLFIIIEINLRWLIYIVHSSSRIYTCVVNALHFARR